MPEMVSVSQHRYDGRDLVAGDPFHADQRHVLALIKLGRARLVEHHEDLDAYEKKAEPVEDGYATTDLRDGAEYTDRNLSAAASLDYRDRAMRPTRTGGRKRKVGR